MPRPSLNPNDLVERDFVLDLADAELRRKTAIWRIQQEVYNASVRLGDTEEDAEAKVDALFSTFSSEWSLFLVTGSPSIEDAITNDATLPWLDLTLYGATTRERILTWFK